MSEKRAMIKTRRLILQPFTEADQDAMEQLLCNEKIKETFMLPDFTSPDEVARLFD
ncbi:GNAT family N-acetyltransferase [[Clostridium] innocuum]|nr:GNAT family N-acetyltransferase [[Clostridium] innocuum]